MKKYLLSGDDLQIELTDNKNNLIVLGKNITVKILRNNGKVELIGYNYKIDVKDNFGTVKVYGTCKSVNIDTSKNIIVDSRKVRIGSKVQYYKEKIVNEVNVRPM
jgi:hypothetical protein